MHHRFTTRVRPPNPGTCDLRRRLALLIALALAWSPLRAEAAADARVAAKAKLVQGAESLKRGDYQEALQRYEEAYALVPSPKIHYNFGLVYRGLGRNADALSAFERFLSDAKDASPDTRAKAERQREELVKNVGTLAVTCDVDGAEISIDGRSHGTTPLKAPIYLDAGPHQLVVVKGGAQHNQRLQVVAGKPLTVAARLASVPSAPPPMAVLPTPASPSVAGEAPAADASASETAASAGDSRTPPTWMRPAAWISGSAAALLLVGATVEQMVASSKGDKFGRTEASSFPGRSCGTDLDGYGGPECAGLNDDWSSARRLALIGFAAGGALAVGSAILFVKSQPTEAARSESVSHLSCRPDVGALGRVDGRLGLACGARF